MTAPSEGERWMGVPHRCRILLSSDMDHTLGLKKKKKETNVYEVRALPHYRVFMRIIINELFHEGS